MKDLFFGCFNLSNMMLLSCFVPHTDPYQPNNLTYTTTSESVTVTILNPPNTVNVDQYFTKITSSPDVLPKLNISRKDHSAGTKTEVTFQNLAASSNYKIYVTSVISGKCSQAAICNYESLTPATVDITTKAGL